MIPNNSDIMTSCEHELQEKLEIGRYLGTGLRYLLYYYGQLAITNDTGLMCWPEGPKVIVSIIKPQECVDGLRLERKEYLLAKLCSLEESWKDRAGKQKRNGTGLVCKGIEMSRKSRNWRDKQR